MAAPALGFAKVAVSDLEEAARSYEEVAGLTVIGRYHAPGGPLPQNQIVLVEPGQAASGLASPSRLAPGAASPRR